MKLSKQYKADIDQEFDFVIERMLESKTPDQMMYYFSGIYGILQRILNFEYSNELLFTYFIIERSCKDIINQLGAIRNGNPIPTFNEAFGGTLVEITKELKKGFFNTQSRIATLKKVVELTYTCTGNGFYLSEKGVIDIFSKKKNIEDTGFELTKI